MTHDHASWMCRSCARGYHYRHTYDYLRRCGCVALCQCALCVRRP